MNYQCYRCGYTINDKTKMKIHFGRKSQCKPKLNNIILDEYKESILLGVKYKELKNNNKSAKKSSEILQKSSYYLQIILKNPQIINVNIVKKNLQVIKINGDMKIKIVKKRKREKKQKILWIS